MDKDIFSQEQEHLTLIYGKLLEIRKDLEDRILHLNENAALEKNDIRDNLRFDFADDETTFETLGEIEVWNRYIDSYNIESTSLTERLAKVNKLLEAPYFARVSLQFDPEEEPEDYYIGVAAVAENGYDQLIIDWRSPIAETYYNQDNGKTSYEVDGRRIPVDLRLRRQFDLKEDQLHGYFDTQIAIEDPLLLQSLSRARNDKMQAITATIQKEQNAVIRHPDVSALLVHGIAGSGKTSVLLQRIAFLFFRQRKTLRPDQVYLMTLNPVFSEYIANVLPDMGERNPFTVTWMEFMNSIGVPFQDSEKRKIGAESLDQIDEMLEKYVPEVSDFKGIYQKGKRVLSAADILEVVSRYPNIPMGTRLVRITADALEEQTKIILRKRSTGRDRSDEQELDASEENALKNDFGGAFQTIHSYGWLDIDKIGRRLLGRKHLTAIEWLYLKISLTGMGDRSTRYVMIDEVQDYTLAQLRILVKYFPNARFMLLGDEFQAIRQGTVSFADMRDMFEKQGREVADVSLMTSYRSSPEITQLFTSLLPEEVKIQTSSVQRPGEMPVIASYRDASSYEAALTEAVDAANQCEGLTAIVCQNAKSEAHIREILGDDRLARIGIKEKLPVRGVVLLELALAKGLEFDRVIVPDADATRYPVDHLSRNRLYTAMSRATQHLTVLSQGSLSPLLQEYMAGRDQAQGEAE